MRLIAKTTIHVAPGDAGKVRPGQRFEMDGDEAERLVAAGAAEQEREREADGAPEMALLARERMAAFVATPSPTTLTAAVTALNAALLAGGVTEEEHAALIVDGVSDVLTQQAHLYAQKLADAKAPGKRSSGKAGGDLLDGAAPPSDPPPSDPPPSGEG